MYICKRKTKNDMKRILSLAIAIVLLATLPMQGQGKRYQVAGVAFYNLENLFDTIPNNPLGRDAEYTPNARASGQANATGTKSTILPTLSAT